jgi:predicted RNA-binding Zn ribbon-like protein
VASVVVDGLRVPLPVAGRPALDFLNTRAGWPAQTNEYLHTYPHLVVWARERGLVDAAQCRRSLAAARRDPAAAEDVRLRAMSLREALRPVLVAAQATPGRTRAGWPVVRAEAAAAMADAELVPADEPGGGLATWQLRRGTDAVLVPYVELVLDIARLLAEPAARHVRACPMPDCGWVFADPSGRRRWCSMAWCGNRSKVRRHAARAGGRLIEPTGRTYGAISAESARTEP